MPFYEGVTSIPASFEIGDHWEFDRQSARWAFDYIDYHVQVVYSDAIKDVQTAQKTYETDAIDRLSEIDEQALALWKKKPEKAAEFLTDFVLNNATTVTNAWWKLGRRPAGEVQPALPLQRRKAQTWSAASRPPPTGGRKRPGPSTSSWNPTRK